LAIDPNATLSALVNRCWSNKTPISTRVRQGRARSSCVNYEPKLGAVSSWLGMLLSEARRWKVEGGLRLKIF